MKAWKLAVALAWLSLPPSASQPAKPLVWVRTWAAVPVQTVPDQSGPQKLPASDVTFRMIAHVSAAGSEARLRLSNEMGSVALALGAVHVSLAGKDGVILMGSDRTVTFGGLERPVIPAGAPILSDPIALATPPLSEVVVSIHVPGDTSGLTVHLGGHATTQLVAGDQTAAHVLYKPMTTTMRYILTGIDIIGATDSATIVTLGDSITDGGKSTDDANASWPDVLAARLKAQGRAFGIANAGIGGNRLLTPETGPAALARFRRDVLEVPGVRKLVLLAGINDIGNATRSK